MLNLSTDFSKINEKPVKFVIDTTLNDQELLKSAKTYIKERVTTNLNVPTWNTQFNYYNRFKYCKQINDKYIRYNQIKLFLKFIELIRLKDFDYMNYKSNINREMNFYPNRFNNYSERGNVSQGTWNLYLFHNSKNMDINKIFEVEFIMFSENDFFITLYFKKYCRDKILFDKTLTAVNFDEFNHDYNYIIRNMK